MFNVPITGARRFAAQSWPIERIQQVGKAARRHGQRRRAGDVLGRAARRTCCSLDALPDAPLIAMVPVSLHGEDTGDADGGGNAVGA